MWFVTVRADGTRRLYAIESAALDEVETWLERFRHDGTTLWTR
jgi:hypothetical protein